MKKVNYLKKYSVYALLAAGLLFTSCDKDEDEVVPQKENEEEEKTDVRLIFTNANDADDVVIAAAKDADGFGVADQLTILDTINLDASKTYNLTFEIENNLETPGEDIAAEVLEEADEHQFFFSFSDDAFDSPTGDGNIDTSSDPLNYAATDIDENGYFVGLNTSWTTASTTVSGRSFTVILKHQPDGIKTATSGTDNGETDFELEFVLNIN